MTPTFDLELIKRQIEAQIADLEQATDDAIEWYEEWFLRNQPEAAE